MIYTSMENKLKSSNRRILALAVYAGFFLSLACFASNLTNVYLKPLVFSFGLVFIILSGGELFTGNTIAIIKSQNIIKGYVRLLTLSYVGNFVGCLICSLLLRMGNINLDIYQDITQVKTSYGAGEMFAKAMLCNICVTLAVYLYSVTSKIVTIIIPIYVFVMCGFEHSIANMFIFLSASDPNLALVLKNLLFVSLGNLVSGMLFIPLLLKVKNLD